MLKFSPIASTKMACLDGEVQRTETSFLNLLQDTTRFEVNDNTLRFFVNDRQTLGFVDRAAKAETGESGGSASQQLPGSCTQINIKAEHEFS
jgi:hypothetical protein